MTPASPNVGSTFAEFGCWWYAWRFS